MEPTRANMVSGECIGDVSTVVGCCRAESKHHHPKGTPCMCIFAQAFHSAPLSHALRQQNFPAPLMLLGRDLTALVPLSLARSETAEELNLAIP